MAMGMGYGQMAPTDTTGPQDGGFGMTSGQIMPLILASNMVQQAGAAAGRRKKGAAIGSLGGMAAGAGIGAGLAASGAGGISPLMGALLGSGLGGSGGGIIGGLFD